MEQDMERKAKFKPGDIVRHTRLGYRAIIVDIDAQFQASGKLNPRACKYDFANRFPWYRLLVDQSQQTTYVEECYLVEDKNDEIIHNPRIVDYLVENKGKYVSRNLLH